MSFFDFKTLYVRIKKWDWFRIAAFVGIMLFSYMVFYINEGAKTKEQSDCAYQIINKTFDKKEDFVDAAADTDLSAKLNAKYAILMDAKNRRVLYEKNAYDKAAMASTTKIMTLLVTLENANLNDVVTVSPYAARMPKVHLGMQAKEQYRLQDLLYSLMLESHNDSAVAIAEHVGGSVEGFAKLMNEKAAQLGAKDTHFVTPNGLDDEKHYSTAYDMALIACYAIENETFLKIIQTPSYEFHEQTKGRCFCVSNKDQFLNMYDGAMGIKTGFTGKAGYCFVGAAKRDEKQFVSVVLASGWPPNKGYKWKDTTALMNYGMEHFKEKQVVKEGATFQKISVLESVEEQPIVPYVKEGVSLLLNSNEKVSFSIKLPKEMIAPVKKDETIGSITIMVDEKVYRVLPLFAKDGRTKRTYSYVLKCVIEKFFHV